MLLPWGCPAGTDNADRSITFGKTNEDEMLLDRMTNDNFTRFINRMYFIIKEYRQWVVKHGLCFFK